MLNLPVENIVQLKRRLLAHEAKRWLRFTESGGDNKGQVVEMFQKHVDGKAQGEPWCMAFDQYCIGQVDKMVGEVLNMRKDHKTWIYSSEHCLNTWDGTTEEARISKPIVGSLMIWQHGSSRRGHVGIVVSLEGEEYVWTVEGNTGPGDGVQREGDGVYLKRRSIHGAGKMKVVGWLVPWGLE